MSAIGPGEAAAGPLRAQGPTVLGMVHLAPLPGTPFHRDGSLPEIIDRAVADALALREGGANGCLVQTADRVAGAADDSDPARTAAMALTVRAVREAVGAEFRVGVQMMRNAVRASLAVARTTEVDFVRVATLVGATLSPHGLVEADPTGVMEYRKKIGAWGVQVVAEVSSMHFSWLGDSPSIGQVGRWAEQAGADALAVSDPDEAALLKKIAALRRACPGLPLLLAGHTDHTNAARLLAVADGAFVGRCLQRGGWGGPVDAVRVKKYVAAVGRAGNDGVRPEGGVEEAERA
ncbi:BtpA/SgcQ family protein [Streptomyces sp. NPDC051662]|uniref:BtpA/SgcQ family protein n=1 Tax=Streptomyces sp. NPDC051662 TaxID=3154750 RepID=UPI00342CC66C